MKTSCSLTSPPFKAPRRRRGFTLTELAVVIATVGMLSILCMTAIAGAKGQSRIATCADNIRQLLGASQIYANENQGILPEFSAPGLAWPWDLPLAPAQFFLDTGLHKKNFYCPSTEPRFSDWQNWQAPGQGNSLWNYYTNQTTGFHVIGYILAYWGPCTLSPTNQNKTMDSELATIYPGAYQTTPNSQRVLVADAIISASFMTPGYLYPENDYTDVNGGFYVHHLSAHLNGQIPAGHNLGFKDGHVEWHTFDSTVVPRTVYGSGAYFWW